VVLNTAEPPDPRVQSGTFIGDGVYCPTCWRALTDAGYTAPSAGGGYITHCPEHRPDWWGDQS
jgi:hypothetical protein